MKPERRIVRGDGTYGDGGSADQAAEVLRGGLALIAEARAAYGLGRRDGFTCWRGRDGRPMIKNLKLAPLQHPTDELLDARAELLEAKAQALR